MRLKKFRIEISLNKSSTYFLPFLDNLVKFDHFDLLTNSYVQNNEEDRMFSVLYKWSGKPDFIEFEEKMMSHELYAGHEDYDEYVLYKFNLTKEMEDNLKLFVNGKYSLYSSEDKEIVVRFLKKKGASNYNKIRKILNRDEELRKQMESDLKITIDPNNELSSPPEITEETFSNYVKEINYKPEEENISQEENESD